MKLKFAIKSVLMASLVVVPAIGLSGCFNDCWSNMIKGKDCSWTPPNGQDTPVIWG